MTMMEWLVLGGLVLNTLGIGSTAIVFLTKLKVVTDQFPERLEEVATRVVTQFQTALKPIDSSVRDLAAAVRDLDQKHDGLALDVARLEERADRPTYHGPERRRTRK